MTDKGVRRKNGRGFKFEEMWIPDEMCKSIVESCWLNSTSPNSSSGQVGDVFAQSMAECGSR